MTRVPSRRYYLTQHRSDNNRTSLRYVDWLP
jgi:hypothetical protein